MKNAEKTKQVKPIKHQWAIASFGEDASKQRVGKQTNLEISAGRTIRRACGRRPAWRNVLHLWNGKSSKHRSQKEDAAMDTV
ncbi:MAG: hypothetical protein HQ518_27195 [Rhodopirellula sp.]|nr:hypothetical protein [Rhodopirellula sp.]